MSDHWQEHSAAFLANRHHLMAFIMAFVRDHADAEDIFQETWIRLAKAIESRKHIENTATWSRGTAKNLIRHYWRDRKHNRIVVDSASLLDLAEQAFAEHDDAAAVREDRSRALRECLRGLPSQSRRILALRYEKNLSFKHMAERVHKSSSSLMMLVSRLRKTLTDCVDKKLLASGELS